MRKGIVIAAAVVVLLVVACLPSGGPTVAIVAPTSGDTLSRGMVAIKAHATDNGGVTKVEFYVDNALEATDNTGTADTFLGDWDASGATTGSHVIKAKAYNASNKTGEATVTVVIGGSGPTSHSGNITADETWYPSGNPHLIESTIGVQNNATLTIKPGCLVKFKGDHELRCGYGGQAGAIVAIGTADSLITFTSNATTPLPGDWSEIGVYDAAMGATQFKYCKVMYAGSSVSYGSIYINGSSLKIDNCIITQSKDGGVVAEGEASFSSFTNNTITTCAKYPLSIQSNFAGTIGAGNALTGNAAGYDAIELYNDNVTETQTWLSHGVPYVIMGTTGVNGANSPILTIAAGNTIKLGPGVEFRTGYGGQAGAIVAIGTASLPITFTSSATTPLPGSWDEVGIYGAATGATEFGYCNFSYGGGSSTYGTIYVYGANPKFHNCTINNSGDYGVVAEGDASFNSFANNTITTCAKYPVSIQANYAGTLGAGNTLTGNATGYDAVEVIGQTVTESQTWLNHGVPYVLSATTSVNGPNSPELTIAPGTTVKLRNGVEFRCGYGGDAGAIIADGTSSRITFTAAATPPSPGSWDFLSFYNNALASSKLVNCDVSYGGGGYGNVYIYNTQPTITGCNISNSSDWGIYLDGPTYPDPVQLANNNTFSGNASGNIRVPPAD
jgi:hypothetical protein